MSGQTDPAVLFPPVGDGRGWWAGVVWLRLGVRAVGVGEAPESEGEPADDRCVGEQEGGVGERGGAQEEGADSEEGGAGWDPAGEPGEEGDGSGGGDEADRSGARDPTGDEPPGLGGEGDLYGSEGGCGQAEGGEGEGGGAGSLVTVVMSKELRLIGGVVVVGVNGEGAMGGPGVEGIEAGDRGRGRETLLVAEGEEEEEPEPQAEEPGGGGKGEWA